MVFESDWFCHLRPLMSVTKPISYLNKTMTIYGSYAKYSENQRSFILVDVTLNDKSNKVAHRIAPITIKENPDLTIRNSLE